MSSGIPGSFGADRAGGGEQPPKTKPAKPVKTKKTDDIAQKAFISIGDSPKTAKRARGEAQKGHVGGSELKTSKVKEKTLEFHFAKELAHLSPNDLAYIMPKITNALKNVPPFELDSVIQGVKALLYPNTEHLLPLLIEKVAGIPQDERQKTVRQVQTFLTGHKVADYDVTDTIIELAKIDPDQRDEVIKQTMPLLEGIENNVYRCFVLEAVGRLSFDVREEVIRHVKPIIQYFKEPTQWGTLFYTISQIPEAKREQVLGQAKAKLPNCSFGSFVNTIKLAVAKEKASIQKPSTKRARQDESESIETRKQKNISQINPDPNRFLQANVTRTKIRKILEVANQAKNLLLTREEFEFLSKRSIGFRYSEKADVEFIHGLHGDAVSLSGFPKAQLAFERNDSYNERWKNYIVDPVEAPKVLESRIMNFIGTFIGNGLPRFGGDEKTSEYLELLKLTHQVRFLLGNFKGADDPYDLVIYDGIGKCGKQLQGRGEESGGLSKYITLGNEFFTNLNLTEEELNSPIDKVYGKIKQAAVEYVAVQLRLHIRKMALLSKALDEGRV